MPASGCKAHDISRMIDPGQTQMNEDGCVEQSNKQTPLRIFEFCMVAFIAFGYAIWTSIYPLFPAARNDQLSRIAFLASQILPVLTLLGYVLCRKEQLTVTAAAPFASQVINSRAMPLCLTSRLLSAVRRVRVFEWGLILLLALWYPVLSIASAWVAALDLSHGLSGVLVSNFDELPRACDQAVILCILCYVLYRRQQSFLDIGLRWSVTGAALALPLFLLGRLLGSVERPLFDWFGRTFGQPGWQPPDIGAMFYGSLPIPFAAIPSEFLNGFFEELIVRAFVMTEVIKLTRRTWLAVVISVVIQTSYHFYQGVPAALSHVALFTVYSLFYARTRLILPVALAHSLVDLTAVWHHGLWKTIF